MKNDPSKFRTEERTLTQDQSGATQDKYAKGLLEHTTL